MKNADIEPPEQQRAIRRFAIIELALKTGIKIGILNISPEDAHSAVRSVMNSWLENTPLLSDVDAAINNMAKQGISDCQANWLKDCQAGSASTCAIMFEPCRDT